jgi:hypothetical protein
MYDERFDNLPAFQAMKEQIEYCLSRNMQNDINEFATRMLIMCEHPISWDTTCANCAALMDDNYAKYCEIEALRTGVDVLKEDLAYAEDEIRDLNEELRCAEARYDNNQF